MFRLIAVTLAGLYILMLTAESPVEAEEGLVARQNTSEMFSFSLASFVPTEEGRVVPAGFVSDEEAVELAIAAGAALRAQREAPETMQPLVTAVETAPTVAEIERTRELWSVTGTLVNLRSGPSTNDAVIGQVSEGMTAEVISESDGWYQIETIEGATTGWIFGRFLSPAA